MIHNPPTNHIWLNNAIHVKNDSVSPALYVRSQEVFLLSNKIVAKSIPTDPLTSHPPKLLRGTL